MLFDIAEWLIVHCTIPFLIVLVVIFIISIFNAMRHPVKFDDDDVDKDAIINITIKQENGESINDLD